MRIVKFKSNISYTCNFEEIPIGRLGGSLFIRGVLIYSGSINIERFINAMDDSFRDYFFLLTTLLKNEDGSVCAKILDQEHEILEIDERNEEFSNQNFQLESYLPNQIVNNIQQMGVALEFENCDLVPAFKMGCFKLTVFKNHFTIGYNLNHSLFDQGSIVYYFKYLSNLYSKSIGISLKKPRIVDLNSLGHELPKFEDINEARQFGNSITFIYKPITENQRQEMFPNETLYQIKLNLYEIDKLKSKTSKYLSKNDIISSLIMKIYCLNSTDQNFILGYICNHRKNLGIGQEAVGNFVSPHLISLKVQDIIEKSILELAAINRNSVEGIQVQEYLNFASWSTIFNNGKQKTIEYFNKLPCDITRVSNWCSFDYDSIKFDDYPILSLKHFSTSQYGVNIISFDTDNTNSIKYFTTQISFSSNNLSKLQKLSQESKLFIIENNNN